LYADGATLKSGMDPLDNPTSQNPFDGLDEERRRKIARIKQAIADGTYSISAEAVAEKLIEHMRERND
jgi:flagellar biosynthesis anti-sigma factor FlgM